MNSLLVFHLDLVFFWFCIYIVFSISCFAIKDNTPATVPQLTLTNTTVIIYETVINIVSSHFSIKVSSVR
jgi:hypothetical protein